MFGICNLSVLKSWVTVLMYSSKTMLWKEKQRSRVRAVQMDNLRGLLGNMIAKRVYVGEYAGSRSVGRPRKR